MQKEMPLGIFGSGASSKNCWLVVIKPGYNESVVNEANLRLNKKVKSEYFHEQVKICREAGLITNTSLVIGYPEETKATIDETMSKLEKLKVYPSAGFLLPLPETGMWDHAIENGYINDIDQFLTDITERQDFSLNMTAIDEEELKKAVKGFNSCCRFWKSS